MASQTPAETDVVWIDDEKYRVRLYDSHPSPSRNGRIEVIQDADGEQWAFSVDQDSVVHFEETTMEIPDLAATPEIPNWVAYLLGGFDIRKIEVS
jgi:hypothetical protein